jgi:hyperosmotically inducible protein
MIGSVLKLALVVVVIFVIAAFLVGRRSTGWNIFPDAPVQATGPTGVVDTNKARDLGAKVGETTANAANQAKDALESGSLTAKIKAKMALDDLVKASKINVDTNGSVVTLTGTVTSEAERERAVQLAKETEGVTSVVDHLKFAR